MDRLTDAQEAQFVKAAAKGRELLKTAMRASEARYDRTTGRVVVDLTNGCAYAFPAQLVEDLNGAGDDALAGVEVDGLGFNLHWPAIGADLYVPALVSGILGTQAWMASELARRAGQATSPAKAAAARANGVKGGRPHKAAHA